MNHDRSAREEAAAVTAYFTQKEDADCPPRHVSADAKCPAQKTAAAADCHPQHAAADAKCSAQKTAAAADCHPQHEAADCHPQHEAAAGQDHPAQEGTAEADRQNTLPDLPTEGSASHRETIATYRTYTLLRGGLFTLLSEIPFEKITLTRLCGRSMVPRSTFYRYFEDKYDLLFYCIQSFLEENGMNEDVIYLKNEETMRIFMKKIIYFLEEHRAAFLKIWHVNRNGVLMEILRDCLIRILSEQLKKAEAAGLRSRISSTIFSYLLADFYLSAAKCYLETGGGIPTDEFVENVFRFASKDFFQ